MPKTEKKARTKTKTVPYDVAAQLRTPEEMAAFLDAWLAAAPDDVEGIRPLSAPSRGPEVWRRWLATPASAARASTKH